MGWLDRLLGGAEAARVLPERVRDVASYRRVVLGSKLPVIVDVWSPSCGPCKKLEPVLIDVATRYAGKVRVAEIGTDAEPALLAELAVRATPTLLVFDAGKELGRSVGYRPASWFDEMIAKEFSSASGG